MFNLIDDYSSIGRVEGKFQPRLDLFKEACVTLVSPAQQEINDMFEDLFRKGQLGNLVDRLDPLETKVNRAHEEETNDLVHDRLIEQGLAQDLKAS